MIPDAYPDRRRWKELKEACREAAGSQCQYIYPNGKRCGMRHGELRTSHRGLRYIVYLHSCHLNGDPGNESPELICLCARQAEQQERISQRRRGYQITTTDLLMREVRTAGVTISEQRDGYAWHIEGYLELTGVRPTAIDAVCTAIHQMRCLLLAQQDTIAHLTAEYHRDA